MGLWDFGVDLFPRAGVYTVQSELALRYRCVAPNRAGGGDGSEGRISILVKGLYTFYTFFVWYAR